MTQLPWYHGEPARHRLLHHNFTRQQPIPPLETNPRPAPPTGESRMQVDSNQHPSPMAETHQNDGSLPRLLCSELRTAQLSLWLRGPSHRRGCRPSPLQWCRPRTPKRRRPKNASLWEWVSHEEGTYHGETKERRPVDRFSFFSAGMVAGDSRAGPPVGRRGSVTTTSLR